MTLTDHDPDQLTPATALALYEGASSRADRLRAAAAMAHVLRGLAKGRSGTARTGKSGLGATMAQEGA